MQELWCVRRAMMFAGCWFCGGFNGLAVECGMDEVRAVEGARLGGGVWGVMGVREWGMGGSG